MHKYFFTHAHIQCCMHVCFGGSFNPLHIGHKTLLKKALEVAGKSGYLFIGLTSDEMIAHKENSQSYEKRKQALEDYCEFLQTTTQIEVAKIHDLYGRALEPQFEAIVVSTETLPNAEKINKKRQSLGLDSLGIFTIDLVVDEEGEPISSTKIRNKKLSSRRTTK